MPHCAFVGVLMQVLPSQHPEQPLLVLHEQAPSMQSVPDGQFTGGLMHTGPSGLVVHTLKVQGLPSSQSSWLAQHPGIDWLSQLPNSALQTNVAHWLPLSRFVQF